METQVWFITGASSGLGAAFARHALMQNHKVVVTARDTCRLAAIEALATDRVLVRQLDVTVPSQAESAVEAAVRRFGRIDILVNNAGYVVLGAVEETTDEVLRAQMETNFYGAVNVTRAVLPSMRLQRSGAIVNISSIGGQVGAAGFGAYSASKFALEGLSEALAQELVTFGIRVMIVEPGQHRTNVGGDSMKVMPVLQPYGSVLANTRSVLETWHGTQQGDPERAAAALYTVINADCPPLRLQLGRDAVELVGRHARELLMQLKMWESVSEATAFESLGSPLTTTLDPSSET